MTIQPHIQRRRDRRSFAGFTLIEMLVVVGIIAVVASIGLVMLGKARRSADRSRLAFQMQSISVALDAYQTDFNSYPITTVGPTLTTATNYYIDQDGFRGARLLCKALVGPSGGQNPPAAANAPHLPAPHQDGKKGLGFAVAGRSGITVTADNDGNLKGKSYGPYLAADKFEISNTDDAGKLVKTSLNPAEKYDDTAVLLDANGLPILYYPVLNPSAPVKVQYAYVSRGTHTGADLTSPPEPAPTAGFAGTPMFNSTDNGVWLASVQFRIMLGDVGDATGPRKDATTGESIPNGIIDANETPAVRGKYILWSAGPDGFFGRNAATTNRREKSEIDDVTNFQSQ